MQKVIWSEITDEMDANLSYNTSEEIYVKHYNTALNPLKSERIRRKILSHRFYRGLRTYMCLQDEGLLWLLRHLVSKVQQIMISLLTSFL